MKKRGKLRVLRYFLAGALVVLLPSCEFVMQFFNAAPIAAAGDDQEVLLGEEVVLDANGSTDDDGDSLSYAWEFVSFPTASGLRNSDIRNASSIVAYFEPDVAGVFDVRLTVSDDIASVTDTVRITVTAAGSPPTANAGTNKNGTVGTPVTFDASGSTHPDPDGSIVSYEWSFGDGTTGSGQTVTHTYSAENTYIVTLTVTDNWNQTHTAQIVVTVRQPSQTSDPVADAGADRQVEEGTSVAFDGTASFDPDGGALASYSWDFGDSFTDSGATATHAYASQGTYTVTLTVTDDEGATGTDSVTITVVAPGQTTQLPIVDAGADQTVTVGDAVAFDGTGSYDPDGGALRFAWSFGDGSSGTGAGPTHTYTAAGTYVATLEVTDDEGEQGSDQVTITVEPASVPPTAVAGNDQVAETGDTLSFDGSGSFDGDGGTISAFEWDFETDGTVDATGPTPSHSYSSGGVYTVTLTVTDDEGETGTDTLTVEVSATGAPTVVISADTHGSVGQSLNFDGSSSFDPDNTTGTGIASHSWDFDGDGTEDSTAATTTYAYSSAGTYTATLTVTDDEGDTASDFVTVSIVASTQAPVASAGDDLTVEETQVFSLDGGGSYDPDGGSIVSYSWDFGDGSTSASGVSPSHSYSSAGTYDVTLTVTDDEGETGTDTVAVTVTQKTYYPPVANAGSNQGGSEGDALTFNGADSYDPDGGDITDYSWDFDGDGTEDANGSTVTHTFTTAGTYNVILTVQDDEGVTDQDIVQVVITAVEEPPVADAGPDDLILLGETYTFDGTGSYDPDGGAIDFAWDFGDGNTGTGSTPSHTYGAYGVYTVSLQVTDDENDTDTDTMTLQVTALPIAEFQGAETQPYQLDLDAGSSYDPDNGTGSGIVTYEWDFGDGAGGSGQTVSHTYSSAGTFTVTLTVTDDEGQQDTASVTGEIDGSGTLRIIVQ